VLNFQSYNEFGSDFNFTRQEVLVQDGNIFLNRYLALDVAENENVNNQTSTSLMLGSTAVDGTYVYGDFMYLYLRDNTASDPVTVTFSYEYQTKDGESVSGTLTLPVL
jgi:hypothetical protein